MPNSAPATSDIYTVSRLNREVRVLLEDAFPAVWVRGELSNLVRPASGHLYFTLKDSAAQARCAMFKNRQSGLRFTPENGMQLLARANIGLYESRGDYQLIIESLQPAGSGALQLAFEALKQKLAGEGLFAETHKKAIPPFPRAIGVITSATGAALRDILSVLARRFPLAQVIIYPAPVQGQGAARKIAAMIARADGRRECDVLILARGGGSLEDLWAFNEEGVARAMFDCQTPLVSGIGHEIDFSIADFVADRRAPTPSAAAELASPDAAELSAGLRGYAERLSQTQSNRLQQQKQRLDHLSRRLVDPGQGLRQYAQRIDEYALRLGHRIEKRLAQDRLRLSGINARINDQNPAGGLARQGQCLTHLEQRFKRAIGSIISAAGQRLDALDQILQTVGPLATLERGYAIVTEHRSGRIVREAKDLQAGDALRIRIARAEIDSTVEGIREK